MCEWILSAAGWLLFALVFMALVEYAIHRWPMHNLRFVNRTGVGGEVFNSHAVLHHGRYFKKHFDYDPDPASKVISMRTEVIFDLAGLSPIWLPICIWISLMGGLILAAVIALHAALWTTMHIEMHDPKGRWFSKTWYYRYVRGCHFTHHIKPGTNFGAVFPGLFDRVFGTYHEPVND